MEIVDKHITSSNVIYSYSRRDFTWPLFQSPPTADAELQPSSVRGGEDFTADFTFVQDHFFNNFQLN